MSASDLKNPRQLRVCMGLNKQHSCQSFRGIQVSGARSGSGLDFVLYFFAAEVVILFLLLGILPI